MELLELSRSVKELFKIEKIEDLGEALMDSINDDQKKDAFLRLIENDLSKDWLQIIFQYYRADRKENKQDFTPATLAKLCSRLIGDSDEVIDMCAGSGALTIQYWQDNPNAKMILYEIDSEVIPYLLFNLSLRNMNADVIQTNILTKEVRAMYTCRKKGGKYGKVAII
jgi:type I restriction enzyme M protein